MNEVIAVPTAAQINAEHELAQGKAREAIWHAVNCGRMLLEVKASMAHGQWLLWLKQQQDSGQLIVGERQARRYMQLASNRTRETDLLELPSIRAALELLSDKDDDTQGELLPLDPATADPDPDIAAKIADLEKTIEEYRAIVNKAGVHYTHVSQGNDDWYTPPEYITAAKEVMGEIDLDPASSDVANQTVQAKTYFTQETDGLKQEWFGRVWMNPPFSMPLIQRFTDKLLEEFNAGRIDQAVVITNNGTDTRWFHTLLQAAGIFCLLSGRVQFYSPFNDSLAPRQGQVIFYLGSNKEKFLEVFSRLGVIVQALSLVEPGLSPAQWHNIRRGRQ